MSSTEEVAAAEARMNAAKQALLKYVEQRTKLDGDQYRRLVAEVKSAEAEFLRAASRFEE